MDDELYVGGRRKGEPIADMEDPESGNYVRTNAMGRIPETLTALADPTRDIVVCVVWSKVEWKRAGFHTHICIQGNLQANPDRGDAFRVLNDRANYAYLEAGDVTAIMGRPNIPFKDGSNAVIYVE